MGIKDFSKTFNAARIVTWRDYKGKTIAVDAMWQLYNASLGTQSTTTLTDSSGKSTVHINVLFQRILGIYAEGVKQIWVFDHNSDSEEFHNPDKILELARRSQKRAEAKVQLDKLTLNDFQEELDFDVAESPGPAKVNHSTDSDNSRISALEKRVFKATPELIQDVVTLLQLIGIPYVFAPAGFEGEEIASYLVKKELAHAVYSSDTDPIGFGSPVLLRPNIKDKKIYEYTLTDIGSQITDANSVAEGTDVLELVRIIAAISGTDFCAKTPGIGPRTILQKFLDVELKDDQKKAITAFAKTDNINLSLEIIEPSSTLVETDLLIDWLVNQKGFSRVRITGAIEKAKTSFSNPKKTRSTRATKISTTKSSSKSPSKSPKYKIVKGVKIPLKIEK